MSIVEVDVSIVHQTDLAVLVNDGRDDVWVPKSLIENHHNFYIGDSITIEIPEWFAEKEGLV